MRLRNVLLAAAVIGSFMVLSPTPASAQQRGGGGGRAVARPPISRPPAARPRAASPQVARPRAARPPAVRTQAVRPRPVRPIVRGRSYGIGMSWGGPYYGSLTWGFPRWWYPLGYWPYWYGPYGYGSYRYGGDYDQSGSLKFDVTPTSADVFVDGYFAGIVDDFDGIFQNLDVDPGNHVITLWHQGYQTVTQQVHVQVGKQLKLRYQMVQLAAGEPQDPRPLPPNDEQTPRARRDGPPPPDQAGPPSRPARPRRPAPPPRPPEAPQPAEPAAPPAFGSEAPDYARLTIRVQPAGAQIFIDGEAWQTSPDAERLVVHLPIGVHRVEVRKDGFRTFKTDVQLRTGETTTLNVSLSGQNGQANEPGAAE